MQLARGYWRRDERAGAVRSVGWWESATVTWSSAPLPKQRREPVLHRALATAVDAIAPAAVELAAAGARHWLQRRYRTRLALPPSRRRLPAAARELPWSKHAP